MKKLLTLLLIFAVGFSCTRFEGFDRDDGNRNHADYTVAEARDYFHKFVAESPDPKTRSGQGNTIFGIDISPYWEKSVLGHKNDLISVNTPIFESRNLAVLRTEPNGDTTAVNVLQKLIVVKDTEKNLEGAYLMTLIPDASFCSYPEKMDIDLFINSGDKGEYSGWVVYSFAMTSYVVRLDYYQGGVKQRAYHMFGTKEENLKTIKKIYSILSDMTFGFIRNTTTRNSDKPYGPYEIEQVIVPPAKIIILPEDPGDIEEPDWDEPEEPDPDPERPEEPEDPDEPKGDPTPEPDDDEDEDEDEIYNELEEQLLKALQEFIANLGLKANFIKNALENKEINLIVGKVRIKNIFGEQEFMNTTCMGFSEDGSNPIFIVDSEYFRALTSDGLTIVVCHEMYHFYKNEKKDAESINLIDDHSSMTTDSEYYSWLKACFPDRDDEFYEMLKYVGTENTSEYENLSDEKKEAIQKWRTENKVF